MLFRGKQPEASIWRRFRASSDGFTFTRGRRRLHGARRRERRARRRPVLDPRGAARPGRRPAHRRPAQRAELAGRGAAAAGRARRDRAPAAAARALRRHAGQRLHVRGPALAQSRTSSCTSTRKSDKWLYLLEGTRPRGDAAGAAEELEDQAAGISRGAGPGECARGGGGATGAEAGVTANRARRARIASLVTTTCSSTRSPRPAPTCSARCAVTSRARWSVRALDAMLAFAAGFMISVALIDLLPEALARGGHRAAVVALGGYIAVHITQHVIGTHFHFGEETHQVTRGGELGGAGRPAAAHLRGRRRGGERIRRRRARSGRSCSSP